MGLISQVVRDGAGGIIRVPCEIFADWGKKTIVTQNMVSVPLAYLTYIHILHVSQTICLSV